MSIKNAKAHSDGSGWSRPVDWGRGKAMRIVLVLSMIAMLAFNTIALIISIPYAAEGLPKEYDSYVSGSVRLPYIPKNSSELKIILPEKVYSYSPFPVRILYPHGSIPYGVQEIVFRSSSGAKAEAMMSLSPYNVDGDWAGAAWIDGLPGAGLWSITLNGYDGPGGVEMYHVPMGHVLTHQMTGVFGFMPDLPADRTAGPAIVLRVEHNIETIVRLSYRIDGGQDGTVIYRSGSEVPVTGSGTGWHLMEIAWPMGKYNPYPFRIAPDENDTESAPDIVIGAVFGGKDGAFRQDSTGEVRIVSGEEDAVADSYYRFRLIYSTDPRTNVSEAAKGYLPYLPFPSNGVKVGERIYPASPVGDGRSFEAVVLLDRDLANGSGLKVQAGPLEPRTSCRTREFTLSLYRAKTPLIELSSDPFIPRATGIWTNPEKLSVSNADYDLGRKDFKGMPKVSLGGYMVDGTEEHPLNYWTEWKYDLGGTADGSGQELKIDADAKFIYRDGLLILLPIPPFLFGFETPIVGLVSVLWFLFLVVCISASVGCLLYHESRGLWRGGGSGKGIGMAGPDSPAYLTALAYSGTLFFSVAAVITFNMLDQSTPSPGILSGSTPVHYRMLMLAEASVWEEVVARIGYIGIPLLLAGAILGRKGIAGGILGGTGRVGIIEAVLILFSASLFGIAHLGWGPWKVLPTFVSGLLLGYLFVKVGVHASITVHFLIDYSSFLWEIVPGASNFEWIYIIVVLALLGLGALSMGIIVHRALRLIRGKGARRTALWSAACAHSLGSIMLAGLVGPGSPLIFSVLLAVPLAYAVWFVMKKGGLPGLGRGVVLAMSAVTLILAPLGIAFVMADADGDPGQ